MWARLCGTGKCGAAASQTAMQELSEKLSIIPNMAFTHSHVNALQTSQFVTLAWQWWFTKLPG